VTAKFPEFFNIFSRDSTADISVPPFDFRDGDWIQPIRETVNRPPDPAPFTTSVPEALEDDADTYLVADQTSTDSSTKLVGRLPGPIEELLPNEKSGRDFIDPNAFAVYRPWHLWREAWGIYISERGLATYAEHIARVGSFDRSEIAPMAYRQLVRHELTHFSFEVAATQLEDALGQELYSSYLRERYSAPNPMRVSPIEEAVATYMELRCASGKIPRYIYRPPGYKAAVRKALAMNGLPGYRDFAICEKGQLPSVVAAVCRVIAQQKLATTRWNLTVAGEDRQVPVYWIGSADGAISVGALPKAAAAPTIRKFEKWVKKIGGHVTNEGKGSHKTAYLEEPNGPTHNVGYATSAGFLLPPEAKAIQKALRLPKLLDLYIIISRLESPFKTRTL